MEELKEIGYEGGKTTHGDVRQAINANSEVANGNFDELSSAVQDVAKAAQGATETAQAADAAAGEAKQTAEAAKGTAEGAAEAAAEAQRVAGAAEEVAGGAAATAEAAQEAATGAQSAAETAARDAATAKQDAATAKSDAASAKSTAEGAQSTAETAASNASAALEAAQAAQGTADTAKETAEAAQTAAEGAAQTAEAAQTAAEGAAQTASTANGTAGAAKTAADKAAEDAATAKSDAATAVEAATAASSAASAASSTASTAKQTAEEAKSTAEDAQTAAATAQGAADGAQTTADDVADIIGGTYTTFVEKVRLNETQNGVKLGRFKLGKVKEGEILPMNGTITLVVCYDGSAIDDTGYVSVIATVGASKYAYMIYRKKLPSGDGRMVYKLTNTYASLPAAVEGGMDVELRLATSEASDKTCYWAVLYESDEYGNPRRRGGSLRQYIESFQTKLKGIGIERPVYNENTGFFEANGLTDLTFDDMCAINSAGIVTISSSSLYSSNKVRTNLVSAPYHTLSSNSQFFQTFQCYGNNSMEVFVMYGYDSSQINLEVRDYGFSGNNIRAILATIKTSGTYALTNMPKLETVYIKVDANKNFSYTDFISYDSLTYMTNNSINSSPITITVSSAVYSKLSGSTVENWGSLATLASEKNITLLAKGDTGYPFMTEVLWHSYAALQKKINDATNGSTIYIHTQDKQKITSSQQDNWGELVTLAAEKNITFAQAE